MAGNNSKSIKERKYHLPLLLTTTTISMEDTDYLTTSTTTEVYTTEVYTTITEDITLARDITYTHPNSLLTMEDTRR
ncbi:hypothetical protein EB796_004438 [Bugula neritina]|uniref:Uncharacterized protein n=1 Tax=Bugula neritina TaxID=10212 RepID=A0A7J7KHX6_BUGNE|nr:hypothetical protein EB796_004438 [Bugula neritina]